MKPKRRYIILGNLLLTMLLMGGATWAWANGGVPTQPLPEGKVNMSLASSSNSYINTTLSNAGDFSGTYDGWCVDLERVISLGETYNVTMTSSCEDAARALVDKPDNLDLVNYIINQDYVGTYTAYEVQVAIWTLIDESPPPPANQDHVNEILADASANGEGFMPGCGDQLVVILNPVDSDGNTIAQVTIIGVDALCDSDGDGVEDEQDNCPGVSNSDQQDSDGDSQGNACDPDDDNDGATDDEEAAEGTDPLDPDTDDDGVIDGEDDYPLDNDNDGVDDVNSSDDICPATIIPESVPTEELKPNHWALVDNDFVFDTAVSKDKGQRIDRAYTTLDAAGCSCEQIIARLGLGEGPTKTGCPNGVMDKWVKEANQN